MFRDGPHGDCDFLVGTGVKPGRIDVLYMPTWIDGFGMWTNYVPTHYRGESLIHGFQFLTPLNADARAMLAIAKAGAR